MYPLILFIGGDIAADKISRMFHLAFVEPDQPTLVAET
jgi:hypothetical protein